MMSPLENLAQYHQKAQEHEGFYANFVNLITIDSDGFPMSRIVTLRKIDNDEISLYINQKSPKGTQLQANPKYELNVFWANLFVQFRIRGAYEMVRNEALAEEWHSKPYLGKMVDLYQNHVRQQSEALTNRDQLTEEMVVLQKKFPEGQKLPFPPNLVKLILKPDYVETWIGSRSDRLHQRTLSVLKNRHWQSQMLVP